MNKDNYNVLFLCTGNSARSILAEAILQRLGNGKFNAYSAGSKPRGLVNPYASNILELNNYKTTDFRSKNLDEFANEDAPEIDFVFTVCDNAANETCPIWTGHPVTAHWGIEDPDQPELSNEQQLDLMNKTYLKLENRIKRFISLPLEKLDKLSLQTSLNEIGQTTINDE